jgi:dehydrogenase/reductase SDR family member 7B
MSILLTDKTVWITGASSGIGEQMAYECARRGARLILSARSEELLRKVGKACVSAESVTLIPFDLASEQSIHEAAQRVLEQFESVDLLINNGGISQRSEALKTPLSVDRRLMEVNYFGPVLLTKLIVPRMIQKKSGQIIVISSLSGKWGFYLRSGYSASKHALHGFFESLRLETESDGIVVTIVTPGYIATSISEHAINELGQHTGEMDANQQKGLSASECAKQIIDKSLRGSHEFGVGGRELYALYLRRFVPRLFHRILKRQSPR